MIRLLGQPADTAAFSESKWGGSVQDKCGPGGTSTLGVMYPRDITLEKSRDHL